ncbi:hypothetical protein [Streptomyces neyagawaensis]|uniref:Uncharacterized protein n=1 Tax=Streptomyces neyagawaensis TaxID=42238 RepID=A0ABV3BCL6_9ACTN
MSHETPQSLEKDGYRAQLAVYAGGRVLLRSRRGTDMTTSFPEIRAAALAQLPTDTGVFKRLEDSYRGGMRSWRRVQGAGHHGSRDRRGHRVACRTLLLGRYDPAGRLQYIGRSTTLSRAASRTAADQLTPPHGAHP